MPCEAGGLHTTIAILARHPTCMLMQRKGKEVTGWVCGAPQTHGLGVAHAR